ncbi:hypothetical protein [Vitreimonas flagellata]|uniref:hypothetical protein n=1 Tax=Vitreimonas flagellata TaxID=2560861 RepID=UPI001075219F|nr:hypothetical protein [Vitreimonas flagellata]
MRVALALASLAALGACQTLPAVVVTGGDTFDVRYDAAVQSEAQVDARANEYCGRSAATFVSAATRYDGFAYRTYRCAGR